MEGVYINGAPQGITFHETDEYTLYPASIISVNKNRFTKHYFIGDKRVASRIGSGSFNNVYGQNGSFLTAGQQDYAERLNQIETQREDYYRELGIAPGIPTMKGSYGDPENTGVGYNTIIKELGDHSVPAEWAQYVKHNILYSSYRQCVLLQFYVILRIRKEVKRGYINTIILDTIHKDWPPSSCRTSVVVLQCFLVVCPSLSVAEHY